MPTAPVNQYTEFRAPYPNHKVTTILPKPLFDDIRRVESSIQVKRKMLGARRTYVKSSDRYTLVLPFQLTRQKALELEAFLNVYQRAHIRIDLYDGSQWDAELVGAPVVRRASGRYAKEHGITGRDTIEVTLTFSAKRLT